MSFLTRIRPATSNRATEAFGGSMIVERAQQPTSLAETTPVSLVPVPPSAVGQVGGRWAMASFIAQLALLALGLAAGLMIGRRLETNQIGLEGQRQQSEVTRQKVDGLAEQTAV